jgi:hypothetical protein
MIAFDPLLLEPLYRAFGVGAQLELGAELYQLRVIDQTAGVAVEWREGDGALQTLKPAASVRASELAANGLAAEALRGGTITINGRDWLVHATQSRPTHNGAADGEVLMFLEAP